MLFATQSLDEFKSESLEKSSNPHSVWKGAWKVSFYNIAHSKQHDTNGQNEVLWFHGKSITFAIWR